MNRSIFCFGKVQWDKNDLVEALERYNIPATDKNVERLYKLIHEDWLVDHMVEAGWDYIYGVIEGEGKWDE